MHRNVVFWIVLALQTTNVLSGKMMGFRLQNAGLSMEHKRLLTIKLKADSFVNKDTTVAEIGALKVLSVDGKCLSCDGASVCSSPDKAAYEDSFAQNACTSAGKPGVSWSWTVSPDTPYDLMVSIPLVKLEGAVSFIIEVTSGVAAAGNNTVDKQGRQVTSWVATSIMGSFDDQTSKWVRSAWSKQAVAINGDFRNAVIGRLKVQLTQNAEEMYKEFCLRPTNFRGYLLTEHSLEKTKMQVTAKCATGYKGKPVIKDCADDLEPYKLSGCEPLECVTPEDTEAYDLTETDLHVLYFGVAAKCKAGYTGTAVVTHCGDDGKPYGLSGCKATTTTTSTTTTSTTTTTTTSTFTTTTTVTTTTVTSTTTVTTTTTSTTTRTSTTTTTSTSTSTTTITTTSTTTTTLTTTSTTTIVQFCMKPEADPAYNITEASLEVLTFDVMAKCSKGYFGKAEVKVCAEGDSPYTVTGCKKKMCQSPDDTTGYTLTETDSSMLGFDVQASCAEYYFGSDPLATVCAENAKPYSVTGCELETCSSPTDTLGYVLTETKLSRKDFEVKAACAAGYEGTAQVTACTVHGDFYTFNGCTETTTTTSTTTTTTTTTSTQTSTTTTTITSTSTSTTTSTKTTTTTSTSTITSTTTTTITSTSTTTTTSTTTLTTTSTSTSTITTTTTSTITSTTTETTTTTTTSTSTITSTTVTSTSTSTTTTTSTQTTTSTSTTTETSTTTVTSTTTTTTSTSTTTTSTSTTTTTTSTSTVTSTTTTSTSTSTTTTSTSTTTTSTITSTTTTSTSTSTTTSTTTSTLTSTTTTSTSTETSTTTTSTSTITSTTTTSTSTSTTVTSTSTTTTSTSTTSTSTVTSTTTTSTTTITSTTTTSTSTTTTSTSTTTTIPDICVAPTSATGYVVDEKNLRKLSFDVTSRCADGYEGTPKVEVCKANKEAYVLSGCTEMTHCVAPASADGYTITENSLRISAFDVVAQCANGYVGSAKVQACAVDGLAYAVSGCLLDPVCVAPAKTDGYQVTETDLVKSKWDVKADCAPGFVGTAAVTPCSAHEEPYSLAGCSLDPICHAPANSVGYKVDEKSLAKSVWDVSAECVSGYVGTATVTACTAHGEAYSLSGCKVDPVCLAPADEAGYTVTETALAKSKWDVTAACAPGFSGVAKVTPCDDNGEEYSLSGCKKDATCVAPDDVVGYAVTEARLTKTKLDVSAECASGFTGTASVSPCSADGGAYVLSGCAKVQLCVAPAEVAGYSITEVALAKHKFDVSAECSEGFQGTATVSPCSADGEPYGITGCEKEELCIAPADEEGYLVSEMVLSKRKFDVTAGCAEGFIGTATVSPCSADGEAYSLSGCEKEEVCVAPDDSAGYSVTEAVLTRSKFDVGAECAEGFVGKASVTPCASDQGTYTLSGCQKDPLCIAPDDGIEGYLVTESSLSKSVFDVTAECGEGYIGSAKVSACSADGEAYALSGCEKEKVCVAPDDAVGYSITETALSETNFDVSAECGPGYVGSAKVSACSADGEAYTLSGCEKEQVCVAPDDAVGYSITETALAKSMFDVKAKCAEGYVGSASVSACSADGKAYVLSGCEIQKMCVAPADSSGYLVTESVLAKSKFSVTAACEKGYFGTARASPCSTDGGTYTLSGCETEKLCVAPSTSAGYKVNEHNLAASAFDVKAECSSGYNGQAVVTACTSDRGPYSLSGCSRR